jgi:hypothetical protein
MAEYPDAGSSSSFSPLPALINLSPTLPISDQPLPLY